MVKNEKMQEIVNLIEDCMKVDVLRYFPPLSGTSHSVVPEVNLKLVKQQAAIWLLLFLLLEY